MRILAERFYFTEGNSCKVKKEISQLQLTPSATSPQPVLFLYKSRVLHQTDKLCSHIIRQNLWIQDDLRTADTRADRDLFK